MTTINRTNLRRPLGLGLMILGLLVSSLPFVVRADTIRVMNAGDDMVIDVLEEFCLFEHQNDLSNGICVGSDYGLPPNYGG